MYLVSGSVKLAPEVIIVQLRQLSASLLPLGLLSLARSGLLSLARLGLSLARLGLFLPTLGPLGQMHLGLTEPGFRHAKEVFPARSLGSELTKLTFSTGQLGVPDSNLITEFPLQLGVPEVPLLRLLLRLAAGRVPDVFGNSLQESTTKCCLELLYCP